MNPGLNLPSPKTITPCPVVANITFLEGPAFDDLYSVNCLTGGIECDGQGHIVAANQVEQRIVRFDRRTRSVETLADGYEGQSFKGSNDLCLDQGAPVIPKRRGYPCQSLVF